MTLDELAALAESVRAEPRQMQPAGTNLHSIERTRLHALCDGIKTLMESMSTLSGHATNIGQTSGEHLHHISSDRLLLVESAVMAGVDLGADDARSVRVANCAEIAKECARVIEEHDKQSSVAERRGPRIVCLCGSTRFMDWFHEAGWQETMAGKIVLSVGCSKHLPADHGGEAMGADVAARLDELHLRKIDLADEVFVLNVDGYIGESTSREIAYAEAHGKPVRYLLP